jgi:hypothetical protein
MNLTQKKLVEKFLEKKTYEGVCGFFFTQEDEHEVNGIYLIIDVEYIKNYSETYVSGGPTLVSTLLRNKVSKDIQNFLGLKLGSFYVGSIAKKCE